MSAKVCYRRHITPSDILINPTATSGLINYEHPRTQPGTYVKFPEKLL